MFKQKRSVEDFAAEIQSHLELEADELRNEPIPLVGADAHVSAVLKRLILGYAMAASAAS